MARDPMLMASYGPKSVSWIQVGPAASWVRKLVVRHTPPLAAPTYTVFPDLSDGSTAMAPTRPAVDWSTTLPAESVVKIDVGPTGVQVLRAWAMVGSVLKMRKLADAWSAVTSPTPGPASTFVSPRS